jgi:fucose permease
MHSIGYAIACSRPPFPLLVVGMCIAGLGSGSIDAGWNAYIGKLDRPNELLGILHGMYGFGAILSPIIATSMVTKGIPWQRYYLVLLGMAVSSIFVSGAAFWKETAEKYREEHPLAENEKTGRRSGRTIEALRSKVTWISGAFLALYVGAEVSLGGWIVTFMIEHRNGEEFASGMASSGFWIGFTLGRFALAHFTGRFGERAMVFVYLALAIGLEFVFWFVPSFHASAVSVALLGFFIGPLFPSVIVAVTKLLPSRLHVSVIGFAAGIGAGLGATAFPFIVGAIAQERGVQMMHPFVLSLFVGQIVLWWLLPSWETKGDRWVGRLKEKIGLGKKGVQEVEVEMETRGTK